MGIRPRELLLSGRKDVSESDEEGMNLNLDEGGGGGEDDSGEVSLAEFLQSKILQIKRLFDSFECCDSKNRAVSCEDILEFVCDLFLFIGHEGGGGRGWAEPPAPRHPNVCIELSSELVDQQSGQ